MLLYYVPVVDHTGRAAGYAPPWFLGLSSVLLAVLLGGVLAVAIPLTWMDWKEIWWSYPTILACFVSIVVLIWRSHVIENMLEYVGKSSWPTKRSLG
jgi:hypothetical protein